MEETTRTIFLYSSFAFRDLMFTHTNTSRAGMQQPPPGMPMMRGPPMMGRGPPMMGRGPPMMGRGPPPPPQQ